MITTNLVKNFILFEISNLQKVSRGKQTLVDRYLIKIRLYELSEVPSMFENKIAQIFEEAEVLQSQYQKIIQSLSNDIYEPMRSQTCYK